MCGMKKEMTHKALICTEVMKNTSCQAIDLMYMQTDMIGWSSISSVDEPTAHTVFMAQCDLLYLSYTLS